MNLSRLRLIVAAVALVPLLSACSLVGDVDITEDALVKVDLHVTSLEWECNASTDQALMVGLTFEQDDQSGRCHVTGTVSPALTSLVGVTVVRDESGLRVRFADGVVSAQASSADLKVHLPGPVTEVEGAESIGPNQVRVAFGEGKVPTLRVASRIGYGPSPLEWAAGLGVLAGVAATLLVLWLIRLRRHRALAAVDWPPPDGTPADVARPASGVPSDEAFWSGAAEAPPPVVGERTKRPGVDPSVWAPPPS